MQTTMPSPGFEKVLRGPPGEKLRSTLDVKAEKEEWSHIVWDFGNKVKGICFSFIVKICHNADGTK